MTLAAVLERNRAVPPVILRSPLNAQDIKRDLWARARDWRDSAIPTEVRDLGIQKLVVRENGEDLSIHWAGRTNPVNNPACDITIVRTPDGGSEITARFGRGRLQIVPLVFLLLSPLQLLGPEGSAFRWYFVAASVAISLALLITGRSDTPLLRSHLLQVVERAARARATEPRRSGSC